MDCTVWQKALIHFAFFVVFAQVPTFCTSAEFTSHRVRTRGSRRWAGISSIIKHVRARQTGKYWSPATGFMLLRNENVINFTAKSIAYRLCYISHVKLFSNQNILAFVFQDLSQFSLLQRWSLASLKFVRLRPNFVPWWTNMTVFWHN